MLKKKVIFARIGHMQLYRGQQQGDEKPIGGGSYNTANIGYEVYNFQDIDGMIYGYFQPHMKNLYEINLKRIEKGYSGNMIDDVLVIWFVTSPWGKGQVVVGWYKNATVYRDIQEPSNLPERENFRYNIKARKKDAFLLPIDKRKFPIGHSIKGDKSGNPGKANAFYILAPNGEQKDPQHSTNQWISKVIKYVEDYSGPTISSISDVIQENIITSIHSLGGQGFQNDVEVRLAIEKYAMEWCKKHYANKGYTIKDESSNNPYDILITKGNVRRLIEVKGTQTAGSTIILTKNEVTQSKKYGNSMALFIVHSIKMNKKSVIKGSGSIEIYDPWQVDNKRLTPISYTYALPGTTKR